MNNNTPLVSVVVPTYNRARVLPRAIQSALSQEYDDFEVIVVDDGSADDTETVVRDTMNRDSRVRYIKQKNSGVSAARNTGVKAARGGYIAFLDDDDELMPCFLRETVSRLLFLPSDIGAVGTYMVLEDQYGWKSYSSPPAEPFWNCIVGSGWLFRKEVFFERGIWFDEEMRGHEDWEFSIRFRQRYAISVIRLPLRKHILTFPNFHATPVSLSSDRLRDYTYFKKFLEKHFQKFEAVGKKAVAVVSLRAGVMFAQAGKMEEARVWFLRSWHTGRSFQGGFYWALSCFGFRPSALVYFMKDRIMRFLRVFIFNRFDASAVSFVPARPIMNNNILASIVIPTYNRAHLLPPLIAHLSLQTYKNLEVVIVNDGSVDNTEDVLRDLSAKYPFLHYVSVKNSGLAAGRNTGVKNSRGEIIFFTDDDDEIYPVLLEEVVNKFATEPPNIGAVSTYLLSQDGYGMVSSGKPSAEPFWNCLVGNGWAVRREVFEHGIWFDESMKTSEDWDFGFRLRKQYGVDVITKVLRKHFFVIPRPNKIFTSLSSNKPQEYIFLKKFFDRHLQDFRAAGRRATALLFYQVGLFAGLAGEIEEARKMLWQSICARPTPKNIIYFIFSCAGFKFFAHFDFLRNKFMRFLRAKFISRTAYIHLFIK